MQPTTPGSDAPAAHGHHHHHMHHQPAAAEDGAAAAAVFHFSTDPGPLLFAWWHPQSSAAYAASLGLVFALAALTELLPACIPAATRHATTVSAAHGDDTLSVSLCREDSAAATRKAVVLRARSSLASTARECALHALAAMLHFALMLLVMTYNIGIVAAVVLGVALSKTMGPRLLQSRGDALPSRSAEELCH
jgi:copper transporter 1